MGHKLRRVACAPLATTIALLNSVCYRTSFTAPAPAAGGLFGSTPGEVANRILLASLYPSFANPDNFFFIAVAAAPAGGGLFGSTPGKLLSCFVMGGAIG